MKVALVHDWLIHMRGGEKVLEALAEIYPEATIYTLFYDRRHLSPALQRMKIKASFLHYLPGIKKYYRSLFPILPWVISTLKLGSEDLVISSSHCVAKGIEVPVGATHVCYCHAPMRYVWGFEEDYFKSYPFFLRPIISGIRALMRQWDLKANKRVHYFIANSQNVRERIFRFYARESEVICPPVDTEFYHPGGARKNYYLVVSAFVPYKRVDLVIRAFNELPRKLIIVGSGPLDSEYRNLRKSNEISFLGGISDAELRILYQEARALIFPTEEDFGIVPVEAQSCGTPVIAFGKGGALETVEDGIFFQKQTSEAIRQAVLEFESKICDNLNIANRAQRFGKACFKKKMIDFLSSIKMDQKTYAHH